MKKFPIITGGKRKTPLGDALAFIDRQHNLLSMSSETQVDPDIDLDFIGNMTLSPPGQPGRLEPYRHFAKVKASVEWLTNVVETSPLANGRRAKVIRSGSDLALANTLVVVGGLQHPPHDLNSHRMAWLRGRGCFSLTLGYELATPYGGGFAVPEEPLTEKGKQLLRWMADFGMLLDLSHAGLRTMRDALDHIRAEKLPLRVWASHVGVRNAYDHPRNLWADELQRIVDMGGIVGLPTLTFLLDPKDNSLGQFYRHLTHLLGRLGNDAVAVGSDAIYTTLDVAESRRNSRAMITAMDPRGNFRARWPDQPAELNGPRRMEYLLTDMLNMGIYEAGIPEKICGGNLLTFLKDALK